MQGGCADFKVGICEIKFKGLICDSILNVYYYPASFIIARSFEIGGNAIVWDFGYAVRRLDPCFLETYYLWPHVLVTEKSS